MSDLRLSIVTPIYNGEAFLDRYFQSFRIIEIEHRKQIELVLIDDGSTDSSYETLKVFADTEHGFGDIKVKKQKNEGSSSARNTGMSMTEGKWIMFLDVDDELNTDPVEYLNVDTDKTCILFGAEVWRNQQLIRKVDAPILTQEKIRERLSAENPLHTPMIVFRKSCITANFDIEMVYLEDWLFWMMNLGIFNQCKFVKNVYLAKIHAHGDNKSGQYKKIGEYRTRIAEQMLGLWGNSNIKVRNNLKIQAGIGEILSGKGWPLSCILRIPCNMKLYLKLLVYMFLLRIFNRFDMYG